MLASIPPIGSGNHFPSNFIPQILFPQKSFSQMRYFPDTVLLSGRYKDFRKILFLKILFVKQTFQKNFSLKSHFPLSYFKKLFPKKFFHSSNLKKVELPSQKLDAIELNEERNPCIQSFRKSSAPVLVPKIVPGNLFRRLHSLAISPRDCGKDTSLLPRPPSDNLRPRKSAKVVLNRKTIVKKTERTVRPRRMETNGVQGC